jgi:RNA polymerase sigma-70 factor (ECF subfamily)
MAFAIERSLLDRAIRREPSALRAVVVMLTPHIAKQLQRYPIRGEDRRDLLQSTLAQVVRCLGSFRGESSFSTWLFRVTANEALMMMRSRRRHRARLVEGLELEDLANLSAAEDVSTREGCDVTMVNRERDDRVRSALATLPDHDRTLVALYYADDLGLREIADRLSVTESAVRSRLHRARAQLRTLLDGIAIDAPVRVRAAA